jgi:hypothetical protein
MVMEGFQWFIENEPENSVRLLVGTEQDTSGHEIGTVPDKGGIPGPCPRALEEESHVPEHNLAPVNVLVQTVAQNSLSETLTDESGTLVKANAPKQDSGEGFAALFEPVTIEALEKMFPAGGKWKGWAGHAAENGLSKARTGYAQFNPYIAGVWFLNRRIEGWDLARLHRKLANNLPARSKDKRCLLVDEEK